MSFRFRAIVLRLVENVLRRRKIGTENVVFCLRFAVFGTQNAVFGTTNFSGFSGEMSYIIIGVLFRNLLGYRRLCCYGCRLCMNDWCVSESGENGEFPKRGMQQQCRTGGPNGYISICYIYYIIIYITNRYINILLTYCNYVAQPCFRKFSVFFLRSILFSVNMIFCGGSPEVPFCHGVRLWSGWREM